MTNVQFAPESVHLPALLASKRSSAYRAGDFSVWQQAARARLVALLGWNQPPGYLNIRVEYDRPHEVGARERRIVFTSESGADVPCVLLTPIDSPTPPPVMICIQGHSPGMLVSMGRWEDENGRFWAQDAEQDFALQAVRNGFAALTIEMRCFGERLDQRPADQNTFGKSCHHASMNALLLGRTMIGERVFDITRAIDMLEYMGDDAGIDIDRIGIVGCSGGGMITFYATCVEPRIKAAMPICYVCTFEGCIGTLDHCACNYIPGLAAEFDMPDLAGLIAPAPIVIVAGEEDPIFLIDGVRAAYKTVEALYDAAGEPDACQLVVGPGGHRQYADIAWPAFHDITGW